MLANHSVLRRQVLLSLATILLPLPMVAGCDSDTSVLALAAEANGSRDDAGDAQPRFVARDLGTLGGRSSMALASHPAVGVVGASSRDGFLPSRLARWSGGAVDDLGSLGGDHAEATDLNGGGWVVGWSEMADPEMVRHAVLWTASGLRDLGTLGGLHSRALGVNDSGQVVGEADSGSGSHAFLWQDGTMRSLGTLGGSQSRATAINDRGQVVGQSETASGEFRAFLWESGVMRDLGTLGGDESFATDVSEEGHVVGWSRTPSGDIHGFLWDRTQLVDLGRVAVPEFKPYAVNSRGDIAGAVEPSGSGGPRPAVVIGGRLVELPTLGGEAGRAYDIDELGRVVGFSDLGSNESRATLWEPR